METSKASIELKVIDFKIKLPERISDHTGFSKRWRKGKMQAERVRKEKVDL